MSLYQSPCVQGASNKRAHALQQNVLRYEQTCNGVEGKGLKRKVIQLQVSNKEEEELRKNHETYYAKESLEKKGKFQASSINFATTHTFVFKLYMLFSFCLEKKYELGSLSFFLSL